MLLESMSSSKPASQEPCESGCPLALPPPQWAQKLCSTRVWGGWNYFGESGSFFGDETIPANLETISVNLETIS